MEINLKNTDELNAILKIKIGKEDYETNVEKKLKEHRKKANMPGFRPGMMPIGLIKKMYGKHILADEINKILSEAMYKYITDNKLNILGEPLPSEEEQSKIDFETDTEFEFNLDLGFAPKVSFDVNILKDVPNYKIITDDELINKQVENLTKRFGKHVPQEISDENSLLYVFAQELDTDGNIKEGGVIKEEASILTKIIKDEEIKKQFVGKKIDDEIVFDLKKAFPNDNEISGMLNIDKEKIADINSHFKFTINKVNQFVPSETNQEFFDAAFGKDKITSEEEMRTKIKEQFEKNFALETNYKLSLDIKEKLIEEVKFDLPSGFLKRWLKSTDRENKITDEQLENEFPHFEADLKWKLIKDFLILENEIKVTEEDAIVVAKDIMAVEFAQYGLDLSQFPEEQLNTFAKERLTSKENPNAKTQYYEKAYEDKLIISLKEKLQLNEKVISLEEFQKFFEKK
jgi:trigger factor